MQVRLMTGRVLAGGAAQDAGETIEVPRAEALRMIDAGQAEVIERADEAPAERATKGPQAKR